MKIGLSILAIIQVMVTGLLLFHVFELKNKINHLESQEDRITIQQTNDSPKQEDIKEVEHEDIPPTIEAKHEKEDTEEKGRVDIDKVYTQLMGRKPDVSSTRANLSNYYDEDGQWSGE